MQMIYKFTYTQKKSNLSLSKSLLEEDIASILEWSKMNHLITNTDKTKFIIFGPESEVNELYLTNFSLHTDTHNIPLSTSVKNLGINIDRDLSWVSYISKLSKLINFTLYRLRFFQNVTNLELRKKLVVVLIFPHFDYCSSAIGDLSESQYDMLQKLLN